jgi:hypothetical protein
MNKDEAKITSFNDYFYFSETPHAQPLVASHLHRVNKKMKL